MVAIVEAEKAIAASAADEANSHVQASGNTRPRR
jgi:hypothetical protein